MNNKRQRLKNLADTIRDYNIDAYLDTMRLTDFYDLDGWILKEATKKDSAKKHSKRNTRLVYTKDNISLNIDYYNNHNISATRKDGELTPVFGGRGFQLQDNEGETVAHISHVSCSYPSPNTHVFGGLDADIMIVMQDWSCFENLSGIKGSKSPIKQQDVQEGFSIDVESNIVLFYLLLKYIFQTNIDDALPYKEGKYLFANKANQQCIIQEILKWKEKLYITNVYKFIKEGQMDNNIDKKLLEQSKGLIKEEVDIVSPKLLICLGTESASALYKSFGFTSQSGMTGYHNNPQQYNHTSVNCVYHSSPMNYKKTTMRTKLIQQWATLSKKYNPSYK